MSVLLDNQDVSGLYAPVFSQQVVKFIFQKILTYPNGSIGEFTHTRRVKINYVGIMDGLHKFQLAAVKTEVDMKRLSAPTAELERSLNRFFGLLVLGANIKGELVKIYNLPYVQYKWAANKEDFYRDYNLPEQVELMDAMDGYITSEIALIAYLKLPFMYGLFFNRYWQTLNSTEQLQGAEFQYGKEVNNLLILETPEIHIVKTDTQKQVTIYSTSKKKDTELHLGNGTCIYLDGILDVCKKEIELETTKFNYSAKWVGLKKLLQ
jgi:hypothetical protein